MEKEDGKKKKEALTYSGLKTTRTRSKVENVGSSELFTLPSSTLSTEEEIRIAVRWVVKREIEWRKRKKVRRERKKKGNATQLNNLEGGQRRATAHATQETSKVPPHVGTRCNQES